MTLKDELVDLLEAERQRTGKSMKVTINELLFEALRARKQPLKPRPYESRTADLGLKPGIDPLKFNQLVDQLQTGES